MLLAIDVGNTNIVFGVHDGNKWVHDWRIHTAHHSMADEYAVLFNQLFVETHLHFSDFNKIVLSSVVPPLTHVILEMLNKRVDRPILLVNHTLHSGLRIDVTPPEEIGSDLIANAAAAYHLFQHNCLVVDFGTATTIMAVKHPGILMGGAVTAGLNTTANALSRGTSQLPQIALDNPTSAIGNNTIRAMQSGLMLGHISLVEGLIARMKTEIGGETKVIATGGLTSRIGHLTNCFDVIDPLLTLEGLRLLGEMN